MSTPTSKYQPPQNERELVLAWVRRARESQMAHYEMANMFSSRDRWLGIPVIIITTLIGTSIFASIPSNDISPAIKILAGALSVAAAVLSSLQTFFKYSEKAETHRSAAAKFGAVRRKLELLYAEGRHSEERQFLQVIREELDKLADESPHVPVSIFSKIQGNVFYVAPDSQHQTPPAAVQP